MRKYNRLLINRKDIYDDYGIIYTSCIDHVRIHINII